MTWRSPPGSAQAEDALSPMVSAARELAEQLLDDDQERRAHSAGVAARATALRGAVPEAQAGLLVTVAWLHDIGYSSRVTDTGFHQVDGARYLRATGWDSTICDLVAHHSGSRFVAAYSGLHLELGEFTYVESQVADALTIADQTVGPHGVSLTLEMRMRDMLERHGPASPAARAHAQRELYIRSASRRVARRLQRSTVTVRDVSAIPFDVM